VRHLRRGPRLVSKGASAPRQSESGKGDALRQRSPVTTIVIADTNFLSDLRRERRRSENGRASRFLAAHRRQPFLVTVVSAGELAVVFDTAAEARQFLFRYRILRLTPEIAYTAAAIDRELITVGRRLGENDNWIAGFCRYYGQPIISNDQRFDDVRGLRRLRY
jgi:predicted nucleic acid-binding protein